MRTIAAVLNLEMAAGLCMAVATAAVAQGAVQRPTPGSVVETIETRGALRVGMSIFVPWAMRDWNGALIGFEIDVARKLARDMGVGIEFVPTSWDGLIPKRKSRATLPS